ncbi:unnamed protein product [Plutella xylostella]|uniref:RNA helicase n=1 Tax=Plutella xylostella TaxID=51655 RepID=A0A8S4E9D0_PLUXY|nr:unnamed protein product [Plutella xylostella]
MTAAAVTSRQTARRRAGEGARGYDPNGEACSYRIAWDLPRYPYLFLNQPDKRDEKRNGGSSKSRKKSPDKDRSKSRERMTKNNDSGEYDPGVVDKEEEQSRLELEMQKRRDRIERWRAERKRKEIETAKKEVQKGSLVNIQVPIKKWSLEDDSGDEGEDGEGKEKHPPPPVVEEKVEEEIDPLDAYMQEVQQEVRKVNQIDQARGVINLPNSTGVPGVVILSGPSKKKVTEQKNKGELIEQNQDGLEYSSEEETEDIKDAAANLASKQRKDLAKVDHASLTYMPFRKNFYTEVSELSRMTPEEVEAYRTELEGIRVKGKGCPKPIKSWAHCGISKKEMDILKKLCFEKPTPIQAQAIPAIMSGRDLIGIAKTGSGKTLAFILPMFRHVLDQPSLEEGDGPVSLIMTPTRELCMQIGKDIRRFAKSLGLRVVCVYGGTGISEQPALGEGAGPVSLIMTPTRELCMQIGKDIRRFAKSLGLRVVCVYGGTGISEQIAELKRGAEIIVCTPGRMIDMLAANSGRVTNLRRVTYTVLDEADRMFDMGFEPQVMKIIDNVRPDRQTVMFSATFPRQMEALARRILQKPIEIQVGGRSIVCKDVEQHVAVLEEDAKFFKLLELLGLYSHLGSIIVFVDKQENADSLLKDLMKASYSCMSLHGGGFYLFMELGRVELLGLYSHLRSIIVFVDKQENADSLLKDLMKASYSCMSLHGGIDQFDRDSTITDFKSGKVKLLVATSVAARGLDVKQLVLVVNYDCPNHYEDYVHRCGRTGRAGNKGYAWTFLTPEQGRYAGDVLRAVELAGAAPPAELRALWDQYKQRQEQDGNKVHTGGGFSGKATEPRGSCRRGIVSLRGSRPEQGRYAGDVLRAVELAGAAPPAELRALWDQYKQRQEQDGNKVHTGGGFSGKAGGLPEQGRYAGDVLRAVELAGAAPPAELRALWDQYKQRQEQDGNKVHTGGGFSGKGFKFDESEAQAATEKKKYQKAALGLQDSDDEDVEGDLDQQIEVMLAAKKIVKEIKPGAGAVGAAPAGAAAPAQGLDAKLDLARRLASRINLAKGLGAEQKGATQQAAEAILKGAPTAHNLIAVSFAKTVAEQLAAKLNTRLNYQPRDEANTEPPEEVFRKYETELEINDFPQQARWRVTSKV